MSYKILIVDDSKLARMAVNKVLDALYPDWSRIEASNAADAMASMRESAPDVAVVDFNMPGQSGLELASELRKLNPNLPVAVISANHQQEVVDRTQEAGATFLPKPVTERSLGEFMKVAVRSLEASPP